jgi:hypothetical protein
VCIEKLSEIKKDKFQLVSSWYSIQTYTDTSHITLWTATKFNQSLSRTPHGIITGGGFETLQKHCF